MNRDVIPVFLFGIMTTSLSFKSNQDESRCDPSFPVWEYDNFIVILIKPGRIAMMNRDVIPVFLFGNMTTSLSFKSNQDESRCDPTFPVWEYDNFFIILIKPGRIGVKNRDEESRCDPSFLVWEYDNLFVILIKTGRIAMMNRDVIPVFLFGNMTTSLSLKSNQDESRCVSSFPVWEYDNFFIILIKPGRIAIFPVWEYDNFFVILIKPGRIAMMNRDDEEAIPLSNQVIPVFLFGNMTTSLSFKSNQNESRCDPSFPVWEYDNFFIILIKPGRIGVKNRDEEPRCDPSFPVWEYDNFFAILIKPGRIARMNRDVIPVFLFGIMTTSLSFKSNQDESRCDPSFPVWEYDNFIVILIKPGRIAMKNRDVIPVFLFGNMTTSLSFKSNQDESRFFLFGNMTTSLSFKSNQDESRCDLSFPVWEYDNFIVILIKPGRIAMKNRDEESRCDPSFPVWEYVNFFVILIKPGRIAMENRDVIPVFLFGNMTTSLSFKSNQDESRCDLSFPVWEYDNFIVILIKPGRIAMKNRDEESRCDPSFPVWEYDNFLVILIKPGRIAMMNRDVIPVFLFGNMTTSLSFKSNQDESRCDPSFPVWEYDNFFVILIKPGRIAMMNRDVIPVFLFGNMTTSLSFKSNQDESRCDLSFPVWEYDNFIVILIKPGRIAMKNRDEESRCDPSFPVWEYDNFLVILIKPGRIAMKNRDVIPVFLFGNMTTSLSFKSNQDESRCDPSFPVWEYDNFIVILIKPGRIAMKNRDEESRCDPSFPVWEYVNFFVILIKPGRIAMMNRDVIPVFLFGNMTTSLSFKSNQDESRCDPSFPVWEYDNFIVILIKPGRIAMMNRDVIPVFLFGNMTTSLSFKSNQDESRCDPSFPVWEYDNFFIILIKPGRIGVFPVWEYDNFFVILIKPGRIAMMNRDVIPVFLFGNMTTSLSFKSNQDESRCDPSFPVWEYDNFFIILIKPGRIGVKNRDEESRCDPSFPVWEYDNFFVILIKPGRIARMNRDVIPVFLFGNMTTSLSFKSNQDESRCDPSFPVWEYDNFFVILIKTGRIAMKNRDEELGCDPSFPVWEYDNFFVILIKTGRIAIFPVWEYVNFFVILIKPGRIAMMNRDVIPVFLFGNMTTSLSFKSNQDESRCDPSFPVWEYDNFFVILIKTGRIAIFPVWEYDNFFVILIKPGRIAMKNRDEELGCDPSFPVWEYDNFFVILIKPGRIAMKNWGEESRCDPSFPVWEYDNFFVILIKPGRIARMNRDDEEAIPLSNHVIPVFLFGNMTTSLSFKSNQDESRCDPSFPVWEYDNFFIILIKPGRIGVKNRDEESRCDPSFPVWEYDNFFVNLIKPGRIARKNRDVIPVFLFGNMTTSLSFKSNQDESRCDLSFPVWEYDNFIVILIKPGRIAMKNRDVIPVFLFGNMTTSLSFKSNQDESRCDLSFPVWEYDNFIVILIKPGRIAMKNRDVIPVFLFGNMTTSLSFKSNQDESRCDPSFPVWEYHNFFVILIKTGRIAMMNRDVIPVFLFGNMTTSLSFKSNQDESRCDLSFPVWEYDNFIVILIKPGRIAMKNRDEESRCDPSFPVWEYDNFFVILIKPGRIAMMNRDDEEAIPLSNQVIPVFLFGNMTTSLSFKSNQDESRCDLSFPVWEYDNFIVIQIKPGRIAMKNWGCDPSFPVWEYDNLFVILIKTGRIAMKNRDEESRCDPSFPVWEYVNFFVIPIKPGRIAMKNRDDEEAIPLSNQVIPVFLFGNMTTSLSFKSNQDESRCDLSFPVWEYDNFIVILIKPGRIAMKNRDEESRCDPSFPVWKYDNFFVILIKPGRIAMKNRDDESRCDPSFPVWEYDNFMVILIKPGRIAMMNRDVIPVFLFGNMTTSLSFKSNQDESRCDPSFPVWEYDNFFIILIKPGRIGGEESRCDPSFPVWEYDNFFVILIKPGRIAIFPVWEYDNFFVIPIKPGRIAMKNRDDEEAIPLSNQVIPVFLFGNMTTSLSFKSNQDESRCDLSFPVWEYDNFIVILIKPGRIAMKNRDEESRCDPSFPVWKYDNFFVILIKPGRIAMKNRDDESRCDPSFPVWEYDNFMVILIKPGRIAMKNRDDEEAIPLSNQVIPVFLFGNMTTSLSFKSNQDESRCDLSFPVWEYDNFIVILIKPGRIAMKNRDEESRCDPSFPVWKYDNFFVILIKPGRIAMKNRDDESRCDPSFPVWEYDNFMVILIKPGRIAMMNRDVIPVFLFGNMTTSLSFKSNQDESRCDPSFPVWEYDNFFIILIKPGRIGGEESRCDPSFPVWEYDNFFVILIKPGRIAIFPVWEYVNFFVILIKPGRIAMKNRDDEEAIPLSNQVIPVFLFGNMTTSLSFKSNQDESRCDLSFPVWEYDNFIVILIKPGRIAIFPVWEYDNFFVILIKTGRIAMKNRDDESRCDPSFPVWEYDNFMVILIKPGRIAMMNRDVIPVFLFGNMTTSLSFKSNQDESRCDPSFPVWEYDNFFIILIKPGRIGGEESRCDPSFPVWEYDNFFVILIKPGRIAIFPVWEYVNFFVILIKPGRIAMKNRDDEEAIPLSNQVIPVFLFGNMTTSLSFKSNQDESRCDLSFPVWEYDNFIVILIKPGRIAIFPVWEYDNFFVILIKTGRIAMKNRDDESRCDPSFPVWEYDNFMVILIKPGRIAMMNRDVIPVFLFGNMTTSLSFKSNQDESRCDPSFPVWEYDNLFVILIKIGRIAMKNRDEESRCDPSFPVWEYVNFFVILIKPGRIAMKNRDVIPVFLFGNMTTSLSFKSNQDESRCDLSFPVWEYDNFIVILIKPGRIAIFPVWEYDNFMVILIKPGRIAMMNRDVIPVFLFGNMTTSLSFKSNQDESRCDPSFPVWEYDNFFIILIKPGRIGGEESRCDPSFPVWEYDNFFVILIKPGRIAIFPVWEYVNFFVILIKPGRIAMKNRDVIPVFLFGNMTTSLSFKSNQDESRCDLSFPVWEYDNFIVILIKPGRIAMKNRDVIPVFLFGNMTTSLSFKSNQDESRCDLSFPVWEYDNFIVILIKPGRIAMKNRDVIPVFLFGNMTTSLSFKSNQDESRCDLSFPVWEYDNFIVILIKPGRIAMKNRDEESRCDPSFPVWEYDNFLVILIKPGRIAMMNRDVIPVFLFGNMTTSLSFKSNQDESRCDPSFPVWEYDNFFIILIKPGRIWVKNRDEESRCDPSFPVWEYDNFFVILIKPGRIAMKNRDVIPVFLFGNMTTSLSFKSNQNESRCDPIFPVWEFDNFMVILIKPGRIAMMNRDDEAAIPLSNQVIPVFLFGNMTTSLSFKSNQEESRCDPSFPVWEYVNFFVILIKPGRITMKNLDVIPVFLFGNMTTSLSFKSNQDESRCDLNFPVWEYDNFIVILIKPGRIAMKNRDEESPCKKLDFDT
ncbi:hypothetical protein YC2023_117210 [Brassica napus]